MKKRLYKILFKNSSRKGGRQASSIKDKKGDKRALFQKTTKCSSSYETFIWEFP